MIKYYINEAEYHQWFICNTDFFPSELKASVDNKILVWGHELDIFDAGKNGGNGSADLIAIDEEGMVWIIEAKLGSSVEFPTVWLQLKRYRDGLAKMTWDKICGYTAKFITGQEKTKPQFSEFGACSNLKEVLGVWQERIGRSKVPVDLLELIVAEHFNKGTFGMVVLADTNEQCVIELGKKLDHTGPLAYVIGHSTTNNSANFILRWYYDKGIESSKQFRSDEFDFYEKSRYLTCSLENIATGLVLPAKDLWHEVVRPNLEEMQWDGRDAKRGNEKSIGIAFKIGKYKRSLIDVGWSDIDAKRVSRENKKFGNSGMKVNLHIKDIENLILPPDRQEIQKKVEEWVRQFARIGWKARGVGKKIYSRSLTEDEFREWHKELEYRPEENKKDFVGRAGEREALVDFFALTKQFIEDISPFFE